MNVVEWLLESDPAIRWQVMRDLTDASDVEVAAERARVGAEGWGARLLGLQQPDGRWGAGTYVPSWTATAWSLELLRVFGLEPDSAAARRAISLVDERVRWEYDDLPFFAGEVEPCINGMAVAIGAYFGQDIQAIVDRLLSERMADGGWNCEQEFGSKRSSFHSTIRVLTGLLEYERAVGADPAVTAALHAGHEYLMDRRMFRRRSNGEVIDPAWLNMSFPGYYLYDVLTGLDYLRDAGVEADERVAEAVDLIAGKRDAHGRWPLENQYPGEVHFTMDDGVGEASRWNTLRASRVLRWYGTQLR